MASWRNCGRIIDFGFFLSCLCLGGFPCGTMSKMENDRSGVRFSALDLVGLQRFLASCVVLESLVSQISALVVGVSSYSRRRFSLSPSFMADM